MYPKSMADVSCANESPNIIYGLMDPRTLLIRYIGKSTSYLSRPKQHRFKSSLKKENYKNNWLNELFDAGFDYTIVVLESCVDVAALFDLETWWINYGIMSNWPLTNLTLGRRRYYRVQTQTRNNSNIKGKSFN